MGASARLLPVSVQADSKFGFGTLRDEPLDGKKHPDISFEDCQHATGQKGYYSPFNERMYAKDRYIPLLHKVCIDVTSTQLTLP
jgi:hypothetical protein